jgi:anti-sigma regulatory factor (Ser/Thr protein kinase)
MAAFAATLVYGPTELRGMRRLLTSWLELTDATEDVRGAVLLATHEAAANAMTHGERESPVSISASQDEAGGFTVEVINYGPWKEPAAGHNGRGLAMMNELMSEVRTKTSVRMLSG